MSIKIRLVCSDGRRAEIESALNLGGFELSDDAPLLITEENATLSRLVGRDFRGERAAVRVEDVEYIESFGHEVTAYTSDGELKIPYRMYELETVLPPDFIRISQSVIVHKRKIKKILPHISTRFDLIMDSGAKRAVSRGYYYKFKERLGI